MKKRPTSVTVVACILIVLGGVTALSILATFNNPMTRDLMSKSPIPIPVQYIITCAGVLNMLVCGVAMLKGHSWARLLYVIGSAIGFSIGIATSPMVAAFIPGLVVFIVVVFILFRPRANEYFTPTEPSSDA
ncbi:hypothetical protein [Sorangium sp. So ce1182]|uniref:hypothetical protein n=1 Tax=Sorangium sp. So ce1182 TaxID=3133334 RepID=UPI003F61A53A